MAANALSIDLEFWWCNEFLNGYLPGDREDRFRESLRPLFASLDAFNVRATFFVLGAVAERYPEVIHDIHRDGHEIACHAYSHKPLFSLDQREFEGELRRSLELLADYNPVGFRAPSFSLNNRTRWALESLERYGFQYDSSIFPVRTGLYGVPNAPVGIYRPSRDDITLHDPDGPIIEFPLSTVRLGINIPVSGGFYLRSLPKQVLSWGIGRVARERPANIYIHPHDIYPGPPTLKMPLLSRFITYHGVHTSLEKLIMLLMKFPFMPIGTLLGKMSLLSPEAPAPTPSARPLFEMGERGDPGARSIPAPTLRLQPFGGNGCRYSTRAGEPVRKEGDPDETP